MSFPGMFLACQAVANMPPLDDEEFGLSWLDLDAGPGALHVTWAMYRSMGAGVVFGVKSVDVAP